MTSTDRERFRVTILARTFPTVSETFVLDHVLGLLENGHDVRVVCRHAGDTEARHAEFDAHALASLTSVWMPEGGRASRWLRTLTAAMQLPAAAVPRVLRSARTVDLATLAARLRARQPKPQLLHAHFGPQGEFAAELRNAGAIHEPLIVSVHGYDVTRVAAGNKRQYRHLFEQSRRIVVTSRFMQGVVQNLGCPENRIARIPAGIRMERFAWAPRQWDRRRVLRLLSVARLVEQKGLERGIRAVAALARSGVALRYTLVGDGPLRQRLKSLAAECGIADRVDFRGALPREEVQRCYADCDLFLFPCTKVLAGDEEGQGIVLQEAQASGLPVLATRHGGVPEGVVDGASAMIVDDDDDAFTDGLRRLVAQAARWPDMGAVGRRHVEAHFQLAQHIAATEALYAEVLAESTKTNADRHV
jgi:colanic acid/amylovoran biosynthesis glycosyltransferase